ncbi:pyruvate dehydrogenase E1 component subunit beta [Amycolatopsis mediterranei S699]|uniref:Pyruvate dehydrogenase E1 component subunit beta n=2 Tax=Amycolatopsis mediterranei TaxID=33910 RepID=A0A0H3DE15_AMYMU|nr:pyruvate dehydrogenase E1 component subunit beta [Amycolatopsis mediterranei]ADJ48941.1 pyruvate dehydrogenase E1 component subunit beta [Amycolatopsis mediterranei U32]AEK45890.1 pyruvate dehydrogenase E1 component subunit beta [Amycolatopsis mediterranei S699]AFO80649.1 pyruvate dehydrogenase E1 component subunit beta [Amycolatopsis mediterranei S699]AGT87777.1 pyruvate dehydrogenase E1 component subunit beta [Amycolatopsis mediterranei RB]KDU93940.1 pyruvate dehydrogenase [Amycolatopsis 
MGAELAAVAAQEGLWTLDAPVIRVGAAAAPTPCTPSFERVWLSDQERIAAAILS